MTSSTPTVLSTPGPRPLPAGLVWPGDSVLFRHLPGGTVVATSRGQVGVGKCEGAALNALMAEMDKQKRPGR